MAKNIVINQPISLANCDQNTAEFIKGKKVLYDTCRLNNSTPVLLKDGVTVGEYEVDPFIENNNFICKKRSGTKQNETGWHTFKDVNDKVYPVDKWKPETNPQSCDNICNKIEKYTEIVDQNKNEIEGRPFPGAKEDRQCIAACAQKAEEACKGLIDSPWGNRTITSTTAIYRMDKNNVLRYGCKYQ